MSSDEWLGIVRWLSEQGVKLTVDVAAKYGVKLKRFDADKVRQACASLVQKRQAVTDQRIVAEIRRGPASKYAGLLETKHRELYPRGCPNQFCDVCVDIRPKAV